MKYSDGIQPNLRGLNYLYSQHTELQINAGIQHKGLQMSTDSFGTEKRSNFEAPDAEMKARSRYGEVRKCV